MIFAYADVRFCMFFDKFQRFVFWTPVEKFFVIRGLTVFSVLEK
jgi:hypothetical protein